MREQVILKSAYLGSGVGVAETQLGLLEQTAGQGLDELCEVVADATSDLADGLVGSAGDTQVLLDSGSECGLDLLNDNGKG